MIKSITLRSVASYASEEKSLVNLQKINFIYGTNGVGKTTISRFLRSSGSDQYSNCSIDWSSTARPKINVFNQDFVSESFGTKGSIKGIYTLGQDNNEATKEIEELTNRKALIQKGLDKAKAKLEGDPNDMLDLGKRAELSQKHEAFKDQLWKCRSNLGTLSKALKNTNSRDKFLEQFRANRSKEGIKLRSIQELVDEYSVLYDQHLEIEGSLPKVDPSALSSLANDPILAKVIVGKDDLDISALIVAVGNSDWVQTGRGFIEPSNGKCPFCQQILPESLHNDLAEYFDATYTDDLQKLSELIERYEAASTKMQRDFNAVFQDFGHHFTDDNFDVRFNTLQQICASNAATLKRKLSTPSAPVELQETDTSIAELNDLTSNANKKIAARNKMFEQRTQRKEELINQVWQRVIEDTKDIFEPYNGDVSKLESEINGLVESIAGKTEAMEGVDQDIKQAEEKITDIKLAIHKINALLKSFGYSGFELKEAESKGFYEVVRPNGDDAKATLSEGERSFITFLYFYFFIQGSFEPSGATENRIVVFDDPVSSLDADVLCIVASLIQNVMTEMKAQDSQVQQIYILTHNAYFHQQVTFTRKTKSTGKKLGRAFYSVRKSSGFSEIVSHGEDNPVKSTYDLLWAELRRDNPSCVTVPNVMRRILEHYLKLYSGFNIEDLLADFEGEEQLIFRSLVSWLHDGSHSISDDINVVISDAQVGKYMTVFHKIFEHLNQEEHYKKFMGDAYRELPRSDQVEREAHAKLHRAV